MSLYNCLIPLSLFFANILLLCTFIFPVQTVTFAAECAAGHGMVLRLCGVLGCKSLVCSISVDWPFDDCYQLIVLTDLMYQRD